jgi:hypothetical protein
MFISMLFDIFCAIAAEISEPVNLDLTGKRRIDVRSHPLFFGITLSLLAEIINSR